MKTSELSDYDEEMKRANKAFKAESLKQYIQANVIFFAFGVVVFTAQWLLR